MSRTATHFKAFNQLSAAERFLRQNDLQGEVTTIAQPCGEKCMYVALLHVSSDEAARLGLRPINELRRGEP